MYIRKFKLSAYIHRERCSWRTTIVNKGSPIVNKVNENGEFILLIINKITLKMWLVIVWIYEFRFRV